MKKLILSAIAIFAFANSNAQSNEKGTFHINILGGSTFGGGTKNSTFKDGTDSSSKLTGASINYGVEGQYGLTDNISAGLALDYGLLTYTPDLTSSFSSTSNDSSYFANSSGTLTMFRVALVGRYYIVNNDKFNFYAGPRIGFTSGKEALGMSDTSLSGINYGVAAGINWFFTDHFGMIAQLGYTGSSLSGTSANDTKEKINLGGVSFNGGFAFKF